MSERAPYSRVYWAVVDDPKFASVYGDDRHLATWLRMLIAADALWPASCSIPATARKASVKALVDCGLIDIVPFGFRIHGLDAERGRRRDAARTGGKTGPDGTQTGPEREQRPGTKPSYTEPSRDKLSQAEQDARDRWDDPEQEAVQWLAVHGCALPPSSGYYRHLVTTVETYGVNAVVGMFDRLEKAGTKRGDVKGYVFGAKDALDNKTRPRTSEIAQAERVGDIADGLQRRLERTRALIKENSL